MFETASKRKCSIFDQFWPNSSIQKSQREGSLFSKIKTYLREKLHSVSCLTRYYKWAKIKTIWIFESYIPKKFHFPLFCTDVHLSCLKSKKKFVAIFYKHVMQNTLVFHSYDKISSPRSSNSKYQSTNVINKNNLIQMSSYTSQKCSFSFCC